MASLDPVEIFEVGYVGNVEIGGSGDQLRPFPRRFNSCYGQPEVGTSVVGVDEKNAVMLIHVIFAARLARGDKARLRQRIVGREKPDLAGHMIAGRNGNPFFRSEEHTSELQSLMRISYAVFCLQKTTHYNKHRVTQSNT